MLGDDQQPDELAGRDAVGEIANVICGNVLPAITSSTEAFHIDPPRYFDGPVPADLACFPASITEVHLGLDSGTADVTLFVSPTGRVSSR
jgi:CheY-specific phosphatase CheX